MISFKSAFFQKSAINKLGL